MPIHKGGGARGVSRVTQRGAHGSSREQKQIPFHGEPRLRVSAFWLKHVFSTGYMVHRDRSSPPAGGARPDFVPTSGKVLSLALAGSKPGAGRAADHPKAKVGRIGLKKGSA